MIEIEKKLWKRVEIYLTVLQIVPFVRMVAVCNNLAFGKVNKESDIDLFVIAKGGRLFIVRSFVTFLLHVLGVRRHGNKVAGRFCLSFFVDEEHLDLSPIAIENDIYLAFWIKSMLPVIDIDDAYKMFLSKNTWARDYFDNDFELNKKQLLSVLTFKEFFRQMLELALTGLIGDFLEGKLKKWQLKRALKKKKEKGGDSLIIEDHILKFHNVDRRAKYRDKWNDKYGKKEKITNEKFLLL